MNIEYMNIEYITIGTACFDDALCIVTSTYKEHDLTPENVHAFDYPWMARQVTPIPAYYQDADS